MLEADFQRYYRLNLTHEIDNLGDVGRLFHLVNHLPYEAEVWRDQGRLALPELFHEWMETLIKFSAGKKVRLPATVRDKPKTIRAKNSKDVRDFLANTEIG